jgi:hypothetical protein
LSILRLSISSRRNRSPPYIGCLPVPEREATLILRVLFALGLPLVAV